MVHWVGENSKVIICLARDPEPKIPGFTTLTPSTVFISYDDGDNYQNKTENFKLPDGGYATLDKFYSHPKLNSHFVFTDIKHNVIYVTTDYGKTFERRNLSFTPSELSFHELNPSIFLVFDKNITRHRGELQLYVSYKLSAPLLCVFDSKEKFNSYFIVDVTNTKALVAAGHSNTSHLYVTDNLTGYRKQVKFTLSLEDVFVFFPSTTWQDAGLHPMPEEAFADVYKVEGLTGIYIASRVTSKPVAAHLGPQHLGSVITFNHGVTWRLIQPPTFDAEGHPLGCVTTRNCSLHLSQKFNQLLPDTKSVGIFSSKSAPGFIMATGVLGNNLKSQYAVYISLDGGVTWRQTLRELYFYNMGDHGGILSAVKYYEYYKTKGKTRHIKYSIDEGRSWNQTEFHNQEVRIYGLMTEPGENTTVFTMFGSLPEHHQWIIVKVDFTKVFKRKCTKDDYKMWSPSPSHSEGIRNYIPCEMGLQVVYQRRMPLANCLNGLDYIQPKSTVVCECDWLDFDCRYGFVKVGSPPRCIQDKSDTSLDVYKVPTHCKPGSFYNRTKGYHKKTENSCVGGFESDYLPDIVPCPFQEVDDFLLFAQRKNISRYNLISKNLEHLSVPNLKNVIAIDFDMANNCVYWADMADKTIKRQCFGNDTEILVFNDKSSIEGMALDWLSKTLYFVDGLGAKIELIKTNINQSGIMRRTILNSTVLHKPRGIALHPSHGYMFWTDWSAENPSVNRANLDGSSYMTLFGRDKVEWPNGITIDYFANRLYWVDARLDYIGSSDLHGDGFVKVISNSDVVSHPFAIAVFKSNMYWDDWQLNSIFSSDKDTFKDVQVLLKERVGLMDLKVFAHGIQIGTNACTNTTCSYICVGLPKHREACLCPDGLTMENGKCMCPGHIEPFANMTCPSVAHTCPPTFLVCGDGRCLPNYWRCDGDIDCLDGSDEAKCPLPICPEGQFQCEDGQCIYSSFRCDGDNDCRDKSDEVNCSDGKQISCKNYEFQCNNGPCIPTIWKCDGESDCPDGSDESSCPNNTCNDSQMSCGLPTNRCIHKTWICDGDKDCMDGRDEANCTFNHSDIPKRPDKFQSWNDGTCDDRWMFQCRNQRCIPLWWRCDDTDDCEDNSDEIDCLFPTYPPTDNATSQRPNVTCESNQFQCDRGDCILASWVCDGMKDCFEGEDEKNCDSSVNCSRSQFKCQTDGSCIAATAVCDGDFDCTDKTDELSCNNNLPDESGAPSCTYGFFHCDETCYPLSLLCDGNIDCKDSYDENNCSTRVRVYHMEVDERFTNASAIYVKWWIVRPVDLEVEYEPSIKKIGEEHWRNESWTSQPYHQFTNLEPFTKYNMTVYVRIKNTHVVFPPAIFNVSSTSESIPSEPWNVSARQRNGSHILISWNKPRSPNGIIVSYELCWIFPNSAEIRLKLSGNQTAHMLSQHFDNGLNYTFWVIAHNRKYQSKKSLPATLIFDGKASIEGVKNIKVKEEDDSISLTWDYSKEAEGFDVRIFIDRPYPNLPPRTTSSKNITLKLAPGVNYKVGIKAIKKDLVEPTAYISFRKAGNSLPEIESLQVIALQDIGTAVKLRWDRPKYAKKVNWTYGVYYGINHQQLFESPRNTTMNESITITNLDSCENYMFSVGLVGPIGFGPLSQNVQQVSTSENPRAPPKRLTVEEDGNNPLQIKISWIPPCPSRQPEFYKVAARNNGSYVVNWKGADLSQNIGKYRYEVLVNAGNKLNESLAQKFIVDGPPFIYANSSSNMYTFAVRIKTSEGLNSQMSNPVSLENLIKSSYWYSFIF
ncbi:unnamed protein product [Diabrotica balteata]|uniref:Sortilin-related receptor n=1 Tax=Diabrotica balteata TaxID=107213 RepID=A0A9P0GZF4_DIABA|nr:unnamed protein product [Diabrotica balteata]